MSLRSVLAAIDRAADRWDLDAEARAAAAHSVAPRRRRKHVEGVLAEHVSTIRSRLRNGEPVKSVARAYGITHPRYIRDIRDGRAYPEGA